MPQACTDLYAQGSRPTQRIMRAIIGLCVLLVVAAVWCASAYAAESDWPSFRPNAENNAVTLAPTPAMPQQTAVRWARSLGSGWSASPTPPILANGRLIVLSGTTVYELDPATGATLRSKNVLVATPSFAYTPPTYADGVIYAPLSGGIIQAIDAATLESLWVYRDDLGGQNWTAPAVSNGKVYGGFYTSDTGEAHFVCLRAQADSQGAAGSLAWSYTAKGGFYWSNPLIVGESVIVGTGDGTSGESGTGHVVALDCATGAVRSDISAAGDIHATPVYDAANGYVLFTTTPGWLYRVSVDADTGALSQAKRVRIGVHCTSTPVVYGGRVYAGTSQAFAAGALACVDEQRMELAYRVDLGGPMQSSPVLSTAQLAQTGRITLYCTLNNAASGLKAVTVAPDATQAAQAQVGQLYDEAGHEQYGICSPIAASDGALFYKNDSGTIFALEPTDDAAHAQVVRLIESIGTVSKKSQAQIKAARAAYDALPASEQARIPDYGVLQKAERTYAQLAKESGKKAGSASSRSKKKAKESAAKQSKKSEKSGKNTRNRTRAAAKKTSSKKTSAQKRAAKRQSASTVASPRVMINASETGTNKASTSKAGRVGKASAHAKKKTTTRKSATKAKSRTSNATAKAKAATTGSDDPPTATTSLSSEQEDAFPWGWLGIALAAAAALIGLGIYRRRLSQGDR